MLVTINNSFGHFQQLRSKSYAPNLQGNSSENKRCGIQNPQSFVQRFLKIKFLRNLRRKKECTTEHIQGSSSDNVQASPATDPGHILEGLRTEQHNFDLPQEIEVDSAHDSAVHIMIYPHAPSPSHTPEGLHTFHEPLLC